MGYAFVLGSCVNCGAFLAFSPSHVPSIRVNGSKEPLCRGCFDKWNERHRTSKGLSAVQIHPQAYEPEEMT